MYRGNIALADGLSLRPAHDSDQAFLESFKYGTKAKPANTFFLIVEKEGERIGRAIIEQTPDEVRIKDISFIPVAKRKGYITNVLHALQHVARAMKIPLILIVNRTNTPAKALYSNLGFQAEQGTTGTELMTWRPT